MRQLIIQNYFSALCTIVEKTNIMILCIDVGVIYLFKLISTNCV